MTGDEIIEAALARCAEFGSNIPSGKLVDLNRMRSRQYQLFARMAQVNADYVGLDAILALTTGSCDTGDLDPLPMRIWYVEVADPGTSTLTAGDKVAIVPVDDQRTDVPPRVTLRNGILAQVDDDLDGVASLQIFYAKQPAALTTLADTPELPVQFHELLVIDLAKTKVRKMLELEQGTRDVILKLFNEEEKELLADLDEHLVNYNAAEITRFGRTAGPRHR